MSDQVWAKLDTLGSSTKGETLWGASMFAASQHSFWQTNAFLFDLDDARTDGVSTAQEIIARLHARQIDAMQKSSVVTTIEGCLHPFHFIEDDIEMTDERLNEGSVPNCGFCHGGCSHTVR